MEPGTDPGVEQRKHPVFDVIDASPRLLDAHVEYMKAGGERLLHALNDSLRQEMWPWSADVHAQASFGAFCAGIAFAGRFLRDLPVLSRNRKQALAMMAAAGPAAVDERVRKILREEYQLTDDEIQEALKQE